MSPSRHMANTRYQEGKERLLRLLVPTGCVLRIDDGLSGVQADVDEGTLTLGAWVADSPDVSGIVHELGHLMVVRDEAVGMHAWGMESPNLQAIGGLIYPAGSMTPSQVRLECRVWAWQWLLEEAMGTALPAGRPPLRPEASFLGAWDQLGPDDAARQRTLGAWQIQARSTILERHPNPVAAVRERIADLPRLLDGTRRIFGALECEGIPVALHSDDEGTRAALLAHSDGSTQAWSVTLDTWQDSTTVTATGSLARAERFLATVAAFNNLGARQEPEPVDETPAHRTMA